MTKYSVWKHSFWRIFRHSFFLPAMFVSIPSPKYQSEMTICICDVIQVEQKCYACLQKLYTSILLCISDFQKKLIDSSGVRFTKINVLVFCIWLGVFCVFRPAFGCCAHPKAGRNLYLSWHIDLRIGCW